MSYNPYQRFVMDIPDVFDVPKTVENEPGHHNAPLRDALKTYLQKKEAENQKVPSNG